jgi:hypothetical protein
LAREQFLFFAASFFLSLKSKNSKPRTEEWVLKMPGLSWTYQNSWMQNLCLLSACDVVHQSPIPLRETTTLLGGVLSHLL